MGPRPARRRTILFLPFCLAAGSALAETRRTGNQHEFTYSIIAGEIGAPELCAKIYPLAEHGGLGANTEPMVLIVDRHGLIRFKAIASNDAARPSIARLLSVLKGLNVPARR